MFRFLSRRAVPFTRVLLVESGSRAIAEKVLALFYDRHSADNVDLLTCLGGVPAAFRAEQGRVLRSFEYADRNSRRRLVRDLRSHRYDILAIICSGEPYLARYKFALAALLPAKVLIINENGDYFWFDRGSFGILGRLFAARAGLAGDSGLRTLARIAGFPFTLALLLGFAARVHLMRQLRLLFRQPRGV
ncbi:MAG: hypothetical protein ABSH47_22305 [Bryobacteraceae bacterium]